MKGRLCIILSILLFPAVATAQTQLTVLGATTIQPIIEAASEAFFAETGIQVMAQGGGSGRGVQAVLAGTADLGMVSRAISEQEQGLLEYRPIAADALAIIVDRGNPLESISREQLIELYRGMDRWTGVESYTRRVTLVNKEVGRATLDLFEDYTGLAHHERASPGAAGSISAGAYDIGANSDSIAVVAGVPGAIAYVSYGSALMGIEAGMPIRILELDGVEPAPETIANGSYPVRRELNLVFLEETEEIAAFLAFLASGTGRQIIVDAGFLPLN